MDRSTETRSQLVKAAAELLEGVGFAGTTTAAVAKRAGVTTGALHHHFPAKDDLLLSVLDECTIRVSGLLEPPGAAAVVPGDVDVRQLVGHLWGVYGDPAYWAVWEIIIGTRTDRAFHDRVVAHRRETMRSVAGTWVNVHVTLEDDRPEAAALFEFMLVAIRGLSLERFLHSDGAYFERHLDIVASTVGERLRPLIARRETS